MRVRTTAHCNTRHEITLNQICFFVNLVVIGSHIPDIDQARFTSLSVFFRGFNQWAGLAKLAMGTKKLGRGTLADDQIQGFGRFSIYCEDWDKSSHADIDECRQVAIGCPLSLRRNPFASTKSLGKCDAFRVSFVFCVDTPSGSTRYGLCTCDLWTQERQPHQYPPGSRSFRE